jgi:predicted nucleotidyltransferase
MSEVVFHRLDRAIIIENLRRWANTELAGRPEVLEVRLIGSLARGDHSARSDADVVVLVSSSDERGPFRGPTYFPREPVGVPLDILVFTPVESEEWGSRFRAEVEQGIVLFER